eukprot:gb/GECG01004083.1/.p1 GENE.gb/GECG01004083.1/~~gb/GECG01004083.1/.p1  ORF type:complete len:162 (+),score=15.83 gb/GECG01004083.1/:1-486(+)
MLCTLALKVPIVEVFAKSSIKRMGSNCIETQLSGSITPQDETNARELLCNWKTLDGVELGVWNLVVGAAIGEPIFEFPGTFGVPVIGRLFGKLLLGEEVTVPMLSVGVTLFEAVLHVVLSDAVIEGLFDKVSVGVLLDEDVGDTVPVLLVVTVRVKLPDAV